VLSDTRFTQDYSLVELGKQIKSKAPQTLRPPNPLFDKVVMRIAVNLNSNLTFDSNLGKMLLDGTVTVGGKARQTVNCRSGSDSEMVSYIILTENSPLRKAPSVSTIRSWSIRRSYYRHINGFLVSSAGWERGLRHHASRTGRIFPLR